MIVCTVQHVKKMYGGNEILKNISFEIHEQDRVGVVGQNGSGKTTLFKLLSSLDHPDSGSIFIKKDAEIGYLAQLPAHDENMTVIDVISSSFQEIKEIENQIQKVNALLSDPEQSHRLEKNLPGPGPSAETFAGSRRNISTGRMPSTRSTAARPSCWRASCPSCARSRRSSPASEP